ncbi:alpha/beta hydrolase [Mucilaginibacter sp. PAMB04274]|uniref:alpha/beta hydrolase n=1 Tax=Mucilaginibacter sp. PAMB04274 TaxID=3138568 RepID=UPI0031F62D46
MLSKTTDVFSSNRLHKINMPDPPESTLKDIDLKVTEIDGRKVYTLSPQKNKADKYILFFHGGAYVINFTLYHWRMLAQLVRETGFTITAPDYPLLPDYTYKERIAMAKKLYNSLLNHASPRNIFLMGDSSGGNLALSLAQKLLYDRISQPRHIVLLSPWLDVSMSNPKIREVDKRDPYLATNGDQLGRMHAGDRDMKDYLVSPMYGPVKGLAEISLFTGTDEILNPDAHKFKDLANTQGVNINFYEYEHMIHDWILFPIPEAKKAFKQIIAIIKR